MAEPNTETTPPETPAKRGGMLKYIALLLVVAVIFAECLIAYLFLPGASQAAAADPAQGEAAAAEEQHGEEAETKDPHAKPAKEEHGKTKEPAEGHGKKEEAKGGHGKKEEPKGGHGKKATETSASGKGGLVEMDLEQFVVTAHQPASATTVRIELHLFGTVRASDKEEFEELVKGNQHRVREQVLFTLRSAEPVDLTDPGLGLIKRRILEKTNALLGKPLLQGVAISEFSYYEQ